MNPQSRSLEKQLGEHAMILMRTDRHGRILEANEALCEISGFAAEELFGQSACILLHPDMPAALHGDLMATLRAGRPWIGIVRQRCKDGGHYWVESHVTPTYWAGEVDGYLHMSVQPSPQRVRQASADYARYQLDRRGDLAIRQGEVVPSRQPFDTRDLTIGKRLLLCFGALFVLALMMGMLLMLGTHALWRELQSAGANAEVLQHATDILARSRWQMLGLLVIFAVVAVVMYFWLRQVTTRPLERAAFLFRQLASGNYRCAIGVTRNNEVGRLFQGLHSLQVLLRAQGEMRREGRQ